MVQLLCLVGELIPHDRSLGYVPGDNFETGTLEGGCVTGERRAGSESCIERVCLDGRCIRTPGGLHGGIDERGGDTALTVSFAYVETRKRPDRQVVHAFQPPVSIEPRQGVARGELTPADGEIAVEREEARRRT